MSLHVRPLLALCAALALAAPAAAAPPAIPDAGRRASPRAVAHYLRARLAEARGDHPGALEELRRALEHDEASPQLHVSYAQALSRAGDRARAEGEARRALELAPSGAAAADAHLALGVILAQGERPERAVPELQEAIRIESAIARARLVGGDRSFDPEPWRVLAAVLLGAGDDAGALATWDSLQAIDPPRAAAGMRESASRLIDEGATSRAERFVRRALALGPADPDGSRLLGRLEDTRGHDGEARRAWERTLSAEPDDLEALQALARLALRAGDVTAARARLDELLAADPDEAEARVRIAGLWLDAHRPEAALEAAAGGGDDPRLEFTRGLAWKAMRRWKQAAAAFARVAPSAPDLYHGARANLGYVLSRAGEHDAAVRTLRRTVAARPDDVGLLSMLGYVLGRAGRAREAAGLLRDALDAAERGRRPGTAELYDALAKALEQCGERAEALAALERGVKEHPRDESLLYSLGAAEERAGQREAALAQMRAILAMNPNHAEAANFLGYSYAERGERLDEAQSLVERALELEPQNGNYLDSLGWVLFKRGDAARAVTALERADAMAGPEPTILEHLGDAYRSAQRPGEAAAAYRRALGAVGADDDAPAGETAQRATLERKLLDLGASGRRPSASR